MSTIAVQGSRLVSLTYPLSTRYYFNDWIIQDDPNSARAILAHSGLLRVSSSSFVTYKNYTTGELDNDQCTAYLERLARLFYRRVERSYGDGESHIIRPPIVPREKIYRDHVKQPFHTDWSFRPRESSPPDAIIFGLKSKYDLLDKHLGVPRTVHVNDIVYNLSSESRDALRSQDYRFSSERPLAMDESGYPGKIEESYEGPILSGNSKIGWQIRFSKFFLDAETQERPEIQELIHVANLSGENLIDSHAVNIYIASNVKRMHCRTTLLSQDCGRVGFRLFAWDPIPCEESMLALKDIYFSGEHAELIPSDWEWRLEHERF